MDIRTHFWTLGLLAVIFLSACGPSAQPPVTLEVPSEPATAVPPLAQTEPPASGSEASTPTYLVTPRGNQLEASDPTTVNLVSGKPVLVEFFRST